MVGTQSAPEHVADCRHAPDEVAPQEHGISLTHGAGVSPANRRSIEVVHGGGDHVDDDSAGRSGGFVDVEQARHEVRSGHSHWLHR
jgi:hypothetical protein